jgi:hypothetical protein
MYSEIPADMRAEIWDAIQVERQGATLLSLYGYVNL